MTECENMIKSISSGRTLTVYLEGDIDHHNARPIRSRIDTKVYIQRPDELILDLSGVSFMDSSGLGLIMGRFALVRRYGGKLAVADPSAAVLKMMRLAGMEKMIPVKYTKKGRC